MVQYVNMMQKPASLAVKKISVDQAQVSEVSAEPIFVRRLSVQPASMAVANVLDDQIQVPTVSSAPIRRRRISVQPPLNANSQSQLIEQMDVDSQSSTAHPFLDYVPKPTRKYYFTGPHSIKIYIILKL